MAKQGLQGGNGGQMAPLIERVGDLSIAIALGGAHGIHHKGIVIAQVINRVGVPLGVLSNKPPIGDAEAFGLRVFSDSCRVVE